MQINWFTVIAQVINFLILVFLLKKFLYKPVLNAIDEREKKIVARLEDAEATKAAAKKEQDDFEQRNKDFDKEKKERMDTAIEETNKLKDEMMEDARQAADALQSKQQKAMLETQETFKRDIAHKTQQEVFDITRKALNDLASVSLEEQVATIFVGKIKELKGKEKQQFIDAFKSVSKPIVIQSAFELHTNQQHEIDKSVSEILGKQATFQFKTAPEMVSGIELIADGYKLEWSISSYLNGLHDRVTETGEKEIELEKKANQAKEVTE